MCVQENGAIDLVVLQTADFLGLTLWARCATLVAINYCVRSAKRHLSGNEDALATRCANIALILI